MSTDWIRPFLGAKPSCPKCGTQEIVTEWHTAVINGMCDSVFSAAAALVDFDTPLSDPYTEHLCRGCLRCYFIWCERTADHGR